MLVIKVSFILIYSLQLQKRQPAAPIAHMATHTLIVSKLFTLIKGTGQHCLTKNVNSELMGSSRHAVPAYKNLFYVLRAGDVVYQGFAVQMVQEWLSNGIRLNITSCHWFKKPFHHEKKT